MGNYMHKLILVERNIILNLPVVYLLNVRYKAPQDSFTVKAVKADKYALFEPRQHRRQNILIAVQ